MLAKTKAVLFRVKKSEKMASDLAKRNLNLNGKF